VDVVIKVIIAMCVLIVELLIVPIVIAKDGYKQEIVTNNRHHHIIAKVFNVMLKLATAQKLFVINYISSV
jgi:hypothetical protein